MLLRNSPLISPKRGRRRHTVSRCLRHQRGLLAAIAAALVLVVVLYLQISSQVAAAGAKLAASQDLAEKQKQTANAADKQPAVAQANPLSKSGSRDVKDRDAAAGDSSFSHFKRGHSPKRALNGTCLNFQLMR
jgi:hypothetical protein